MLKSAWHGQDEAVIITAHAACAVIPSSRPAARTNASSVTMSKLRISLVQESPNQVHYSGNTVKGNLLLDVNKPKNYKRITIQFTGKCSTSLAGRRNSESADKDNSSIEAYVDLATTLWNSQDFPDGKLTPGQHSWPFSFAIPQTAPSSFEGNFGSIRYTLEGRIVTGSSKSSHVVEARVPVQQLVVYTDPALLRPQHQEVTKRMGGGLCCASQPIILRAVVPRTSFYIGDSFKLQVSLENGSGLRIAVSASIKQDVKFAAGQGKHKWGGKTIATVANTNAEPRGTCDWEPIIEIPSVDVVDEGSCKNIKVSHSLIVSCKIPRTDNLFTLFPLKISNWQPPEWQAPPTTNPQLNEGYPPQATIPQIPPVAPTAPPHFPVAPPQPNAPIGIHPAHNVSFQPQHYPSPLQSATMQYPGASSLPPPPCAPGHPGGHPPFSHRLSGGVPTPFAAATVPVAISQWDSTMSLQRGWS